MDHVEKSWSKLLAPKARIPEAKDQAEERLVIITRTMWWNIKAKNEEN